ncbi:hypothetical protein RclHR1_00620015 [Rhizophagus clarus]|nr:hypothetical protein RclHR1_00620015 [Rhizophagus clarus]
MIYLFGCLMVNDNTSLIYQYDINSNKWAVSSTVGPSLPAHRIRNDVVIESSTGRIFYFGGNDDANRLLNDMWIFNTNNNQLSWQQITTASISICCFSAILLPDGYILYIGGRSNDKDRDFYLNNITRYNTKSNDWDVKKTKGDNILYRPGFSANLVPDGRIIVYGGTEPLLSITVQDDLYVLNTTTYEWTIPEVENKPITKSFHTACLYENYMIVAFGMLNDNLPDSKIYLLDITNKITYKWVTDFKSAESIENRNTHVVIIICAVVSSTSILIFIGLYRPYKKKGNNKQESSKIVFDDLN